MSSYYKQKQYLATCNKKGEITGTIEKWEAHRKGILHRAYTIAILCEGKILLQHRKHPAFDGVMDATISSHQLMKDGVLEDTFKSCMNALSREWNITKKDFVKPLVNKGWIYYRAKDKYSEYFEHEVCDVVICEIKKIKTPNLEFAYGYSVLDLNEIRQTESQIFSQLAPWVKVMIKENLL